MASLTFGRYSPYNTFVHRLDSRNKLFLTILLMVGIFFQFSVWSTTFIFTGLYLLFLLIVLIIAKVNFFDLFKSLAGMWLLIIFLMAIYIFIPNGQNVQNIAFSIGSVNVYWESIFQGLYIIFRLILMIMLTMVLTSSTKPMDLTYAFEWYMTPLKPIHFPVHEIAMTLSIALRFIPTILDETDRIMKAQSSRGVDFNHGTIFKRFGAVISLIIPLFVSAIERSEELSNAMEARGYNPREKRTHYRKLKFSWRDLIGFVLGVSFFALVLYTFIIDKHYHQVDLIQFFFNVNVGF